MSSNLQHVAGNTQEKEGRSLRNVVLGSPYLCVSHPLSTLRSNPRSLSSCWCSNTFLLCWMASWTCQAHTQNLGWGCSTAPNSVAAAQECSGTNQVTELAASNDQGYRPALHMSLLAAPAKYSGTVSAVDSGWTQRHDHLQEMYSFDHQCDSHSTHRAILLRCHLLQHAHHSEQLLCCKLVLTALPTFCDMPASVCSCSAASLTGRSSTTPWLAGVLPSLRMACARLYREEW